MIERDKRFKHRLGVKEGSTKFSEEKKKRTKKKREGKEKKI